EAVAAAVDLTVCQSALAADERDLSPRDPGACFEELFELQSPSLCGRFGLFFDEPDQAVDGVEIFRQQLVVLHLDAAGRVEKSDQLQESGGIDGRLFQPR